MLRLIKAMFNRISFLLQPSPFLVLSLLTILVCILSLLYTSSHTFPLQSKSVSVGPNSPVGLKSKVIYTQTTYKMFDNTWPVPEQEFLRYLESDLCEEISTGLAKSYNVIYTVSSEPSRIHCRTENDKGEFHAIIGWELDVENVFNSKLNESLERIVDEGISDWLASRERSWQISPKSPLLSITELHLNKKRNSTGLATLDVKFRIDITGDSLEAAKMDWKQVQYSQFISRFSENRQTGVEIFMEIDSIPSQIETTCFIQSHESLSPSDHLEVALQVKIPDESLPSSFRILRTKTSMEVPKYISETYTN